MQILIFSEARAERDATKQELIKTVAKNKKLNQTIISLKEQATLSTNSYGNVKKDPEYRSLARERIRLHNDNLALQKESHERLRIIQKLYNDKGYDEYDKDHKLLTKFIAQEKKFFEITNKYTNIEKENAVLTKQNDQIAYKFKILENFNTLGENHKFFKSTDAEVQTDRIKVKKFCGENCALKPKINPGVDLPVENEEIDVFYDPHNDIDEIEHGENPACKQQ